MPADRWQDAIDDDLLGLLHDGDVARARERLVAALGRSALTPAAWWREEVRP